MSYCERCRVEFVSDHVLWQHEAKSPKHNICDACNEDFSTARAFNQHYAECHEERHCQWCHMYFDKSLALIQHHRTQHRYCNICDLAFRDGEAIEAHNVSAEHTLISCPGRKCNRRFGSAAALISHLEFGACSSKMNRNKINQLAVDLDRTNVITNPLRLLRAPDGYAAPPHPIINIATELSFNGQAYECFLCHREFKKLEGLNQHLVSPVHEAAIYRCPQQWQGCNTEFRTLSGLCQHVEKQRCAVRRFNRPMQKVVESMASAMKGLVL